MGYGVIRKPIDPTKMIDTLKAYMGKGEPPAAKEGESVSIEELLGWDVTEEDKTKVTEWQEAAPDSPDIAGIASGTFGTQEAMVQEDIREQPEEQIQEQTQEQTGGAPAEEPVEAPAEEEAAVSTTETPVSIEADLRDRITDDRIEEIISRIAREIVERAAWVVVPKIAEEEIRREIERLKGESG